MDIDKLTKNLESNFHVQKEKVAELSADLQMAKRCYTFEGRISVLENEARNQVENNDKVFD